MSVSDPGEKIEWGADSEPWKNERVPSSACYTLYEFILIHTGKWGRGGGVVGEPVRRLEGRYSSQEGSKIPT